MDRRQRKTREAIFAAFTDLLARKPYHRIAVQDIIDAADCGRTTFYSHFETKDHLLKALCAELFDHIVDTAMGLPAGHYHCSCAKAEDSVFLHLLRHLQENDRHIVELLTSQNNELFLREFKDNLKKLILSQYTASGAFAASALPEEYLVNHIAAAFVETVHWWLSRGMRDTPETVAAWFLATIEPLLGEGRKTL